MFTSIIARTALGLTSEKAVRHQSSQIQFNVVERRAWVRPAEMHMAVLKPGEGDGMQSCSRNDLEFARDFELGLTGKNSYYRVDNNVTART